MMGFVVSHKCSVPQFLNQTHLSFLFLKQQGGRRQKQQV